MAERYIKSAKRCLVAGIRHNWIQRSWDFGTHESMIAHYLS
jgi:hypothetical protein